MFFRSIAFVLIGCAILCAQAAPKSKPPKLVPKPQASTAAPAKPDGRKQFVLDVAKSAVALPQADEQDRLRVLASAVRVLSPLDAKTAQSLTKEAVRIESDLIRAGRKPAVSIFSTGRVDCATVTNFVENLPVTSVAVGQDALIRGVSSCSKQALIPVQQKLEAALNVGALAARPLLAAMSVAGPQSSWSQRMFTAMFDSLPRDYEKQLTEAPNYAAMYSQMASAVDADVAKKAGISLLDWIGHLPESGERNLALNMTTGAMRKALGEEKYQDALRGNIVVSGIVRQAGKPGQIQHGQEESVSVLRAMGNNGQDLTEQLGKLPASRRAREAAAHGFASGTGGDRKLAERYFDMAYSALNEVWEQRAPEGNAPAVVEEVNEAAAQVDAVAALNRAQQLQDPSAQAIGMLAVARVVASRQAPDVAVRN